MKTFRDQCINKRRKELVYIMYIVFRPSLRLFRPRASPSCSFLYIPFFTSMPQLQRLHCRCDGRTLLGLLAPFPRWPNCQRNGQNKTLDDGRANSNLQPGAKLVTIPIFSPGRNCTSLPLHSPTTHTVGLNAWVQRRLQNPLGQQTPSDTPKHMASNAQQNSFVLALHNLTCTLFGL